MDLEDTFLAKVSGVQSLSSSVQSTPEKNGNSDDASRSPELLQEFLKSGPKKELLRTCFDKEKKQTASSKSKMTELLKTGNKTYKKPESKKAASSPNNQPSFKKQQRKGENPMRLVPSSEQSSEFGCSNSWICKNSACRAVLSIDDTFCKRCSCCICHLFDDNKDPSLWLVCTSDNGQGDSCELSCHIECALQREKVGVVDLGQLMQLDGSYCCASCGKVSGILRSWKKHLIIAKDARRLDVLCYRIYLSYRLLDGTSRFKELHGIVKDAKAKIETEVGPVDGVSAKMARGIVSRLSVAGDVQKLCSLAIEKAEEWLTTISSANPNCREDSLPAACRFLFEEVKSSSVVIILIELSTALSDDIKGYKLWYCKSREETHAKEPICMFPRSQRRILISNLQPCTEYTFRIVSYTEAGDLGHSEAKCFTKSIEIIQKNPNPSVARNGKKENTVTGGYTSSYNRDSKTTTAVNSSGFMVRDLGKILHLAGAQQQGCFEGFCSADTEKCCGGSKVVKPQTSEDPVPSISHGLDLNVVSVPDLNEELTPFESSRDEDNGCTLEQAIEADDDAASHDVEKNDLARSHGTGDSQTWMHGPSREVPTVDSRSELCRKRAAHTNEDGSPIASDILREGQLGDYVNIRRLMEIIICKVIKGDMQALEDLTYERRKEFLTKHQLPSELPVVSFHTEAGITPAVLATLSHVAHAELPLMAPLSAGELPKLPVVIPLGAAMAACAQLLQIRYGEKSDGLVTCRDAEVPGSTVVRPKCKLDHAWMVYSSLNGDPSDWDASQVCEALLTLLVEVGQRKRHEFAMKDE